MQTSARRGFPALLLAVLSLSGCFVATARYEEKVREADALRNALAAANKSRVTAEARLEAAQRQISEASERNEALAARLKATEEDARKTNEELGLARKNYEGTRITREQLISELLEKEKATGKRIQELVGRAQECELALETARKEAALRDAAMADLRRKADSTPDAEALRRERDILIGRVERLTEERRIEEKTRDDRYRSLAQSLGSADPPVAVAVLGATARVTIAEKDVGAAKGRRLSAAGQGTVAEVGKAAAELRGASLVVTAGSASVAEEIRGLLVSAAKVPAERILVSVRERERGAELLLIAP